MAEKLSPLAALLRKSRVERTEVPTEGLVNPEPLPKTEPVTKSGPPPESDTGTPPEIPQPPLQTEPVPNSEPLAKTGGVTRLSDAAPHMRFPYEVLDKILGEFKPGPRVVLERLYRLSAGFYSETCTVSIAKLASYCKIGTTQTRQYLRLLEDSGWVTRLDNIVGDKNFEVRGILYRVNLPMMLPPQKRTPPESGTGYEFRTGPKSVANKYKDLKENNKKGVVASLDYKTCPDCQGTGMFYPEGYDKGAAKCRHPKLKT